YVGLNYYKPERIELKIKKTENKYAAKIEKKKDTKRAEKLKDKRDRKVAKKRLALEKGNLLMRWGEPLSVYDSDKITQTTEQMDLYLKTKGYFHSSADHEVRKKGKKMKVTYSIEEGRPHAIDTFILTTDDKN